MKITSVRYRKLITGPNYSNEMVEAECAVQEGDTPEDTLQSVKSWVLMQLQNWETDRKMYATRNELTTEIYHLERTRNRLKADIAEMNAPAKDKLDEIPF